MSKKRLARAVPRKRGAQPGNHNAVKHGFYSHNFSSFEQLAVSDIPARDLSDDIILLRSIIARQMENYTAALPDLSYQQRLSSLRAVTIAFGRLISLQRLQSALNRTAWSVDSGSPPQDRFISLEEMMGWDKLDGLEPPSSHSGQ